MVYVKYIGDPWRVTPCPNLENVRMSGVCADGQCPGYIDGHCSFSARSYGDVLYRNLELFMIFPDKKCAENHNFEEDQECHTV